MARALQLWVPPCPAHRAGTSKAGRLWVGFGAVARESLRKVSDVAGHQGAPDPLSSAGFSVLQDELPVRHSQAHEHAASREGEACGHPLIVSDEDLSIGYSMVQDGPSRMDGDSPAGERLPQEQVRRGLAGTGSPEEPAPEPQPQRW